MLLSYGLRSWQRQHNLMNTVQPGRVHRRKCARSSTPGSELIDPHQLLPNVVAQA
jgi:hypothetical protein